MQALKKISQFALVSALLAGCQANNEEESLQETTEREESTEVVETEASEESESTEAEEELTKEDYIELYQPALEFVADKEDETEPDYFTFYDVNNDGILEFITASEDMGPDDLYINEAFYLRDGETPELMGESYVAPVGGRRAAINIYDDGTFLQLEFSSGTGEGQSMLYEIADDQSDLVLIGENSYNVFAEEEDELREGREDIDLNELEWFDFQEMLITSETSENQADDVPFYLEGSQEEVYQEESSEETTESPSPSSNSMDVNAIAQGDFSSIAGTWRNGVGDELSFDANGMASNDFYIYSASLEGSIGSASVSQSNGIGGYALYFLPAGQTKEPVDSSDSSQDRIWAGQSPTDDVNLDYYYKVD